jgi:hypothetical protein
MGQRERPISDAIADAMAGAGKPRLRSEGEMQYALLAELMEGALRMQSLMTPDQIALPWGEYVGTFAVCQLVIVESEMHAISSGDLRSFEDLRALLVKFAQSTLPQPAAERIARCAAGVIDRIDEKKKAKDAAKLEGEPANCGAGVAGRMGPVRIPGAKVKVSERQDEATSRKDVDPNRDTGGSD